MARTADDAPEAYREWTRILKEVSVGHGVANIFAINNSGRRYSNYSM